MTVINTNTSAMRATNASSMASKALSTSMERLSTGKRINSAKDDAAGLAIANRMSSQTKSMAMAVRNANDGISLAQTAEGAMSEVTNMLTRMKELATQSANGTLQDSDRTALQSEMTQLTAEVNNVSKTTSFNGVNLLDGSSNSVKLQTGINANQNISMALTDTRASTLGLTAQVVSTQISATAFAAPAGTPPVPNITVNGQDINAVAATPKDAKAIAALVNATTANSGVTATAKNSISATVGTISTGNTLTIGDGTTNTVVTMTAAEKDVNSLAAKINSTLSNVSGNQINASVDSNGKLQLTSKDGSNISLANSSGSIVTNITDAGNNSTAPSGTTAVVSRGTVTLEGAGGTGVTIGGADPGKAGFTAGSTSAISIASQTGASAAMSVIDNALDQVSAARGTMGAAQNRLESTVNNLTTTSTNLSDAKSRIEDADFSTETTALAKAQILGQASTAMLAQANQSQQGVMKLLG
ncbi:flagellin [uncultured Sphingomonas sp.]|uniref:flagellin N-terminal helical domain-containing protein n=1 Tax=uncultured Sphingomonas sp. TaxID=158754 RepID=UPI0025CB8B96|nr:flagellin [uncultured Sphingomonas sp.]